MNGVYENTNNNAEPYGTLPKVMIMPENKWFYTHYYTVLLNHNDNTHSYIPELIMIFIRRFLVLHITCILLNKKIYFELVSMVE